MCYSAQIWADYRRYVRAFGADIDLQAFHELFWRRVDDARIKIPRAVDAAFLQPADEALSGLEMGIRQAIERYTASETVKLEQMAFEQRTRLADAERVLQTKQTKAALNSQRIATDKIDWARKKLAALKRTDVTDADARIFPGHYAPVMVVEDGRRVVRPMRYQCRPAGKPAFHDTKFPGTYNARRDNLEGFWRDLFGFSHGIMVVNAFFENVDQHRVEGRELGPDEKAKSRVLEFRPRPTQDMLVACLWSRWSAPGEPELLSFAAITDEPPAEVAAAGHDRCIVPIKPEHVEAWLNPDRRRLIEQQAILEDRDRPYYAYQLAA